MNSLQPSCPLTVTDRTQPLHRAVKDALNRYLTSLADQEPTDVYRLVIEEVERPLLECVMNHCRGNQSRAARVLGLSRATLRKKLRQYDLLH
ncbi:MAG TPA: DNA-binding transcriptional regulator Fis [Chromatiales bacterium]|nr:DNA-binding transcriptional regulator Fis [Chromatiales bacterium]